MKEFKVGDKVRIEGSYAVYTIISLGTSSDCKTIATLENSSNSPGVFWVKHIYDLHPINIAYAVVSKVDNENGIVAIFKHEQMAKSFIENYRINIQWLKIKEIETDIFNLKK